MSTVEVDLGQYVGLLIKASCTDAAQWPEPAREGAAWLATIRGYETACRKAHGEWDFELLSEEDQLEYDSAAAQLDALLRRLNPEPTVTLDEYLQKRGIKLE